MRALLGEDPALDITVSPLPLFFPSISELLFSSGAYINLLDHSFTERSGKVTDDRLS